MEEHAICQIVYTNVEAKESPNRRGGFQTLFFSKDILSRTDVANIEGRIHFLPGKGLLNKETVFFMNIGGRHRIVVLCFHDLPGEKDSFGRGGIFICHGFLFPPELWKAIPSYADLMSFVRPQIFTDRTQALSSPHADKTKGDIAPISVPADAIRTPKSLPILDTEPGPALAFLLQRLATTEDDPPPLLIKGETDAVSEMMGRAMCWVPEEIRHHIGWDPFYEEGSFYHFPLEIVGFKTQLPFSGDHILADLETGTVDPGPFADFANPATPYEKWLLKASRSNRPPEDVILSYSFSLALLGQPYDPIPEEAYRQVDGFVEINREQIEEVFTTQMTEKTGRALTEILGTAIDDFYKLELVYRGLESGRVGSVLEKTLIMKKKKPNFMNKRRLTWIRETDLPRLKLMHNTWQGEDIREDDINGLAGEDRNELFEYWLATEKITQPWLVELCQADAVYRARLLELLVQKKGMKTGDLLEFNFGFEEIIKACESVLKYLPNLLSALLEKSEYDLAREVLDVPMQLKGERKDVAAIIEGKHDIPRDIVERIEKIIADEEGRKLFNRFKAFVRNRF